MILISDYLIIVMYLIYLQPLKATIITPKIVIIGAGSSGLAAATKLLEYGFENFTILEAESRIGGRIHTTPFADNNVDLGAQWCHGEKNNVVYEMVEEYDLLQHSFRIEKNGTYVRSNHEMLDHNLGLRLFNMVEDIWEDPHGERKNYKLSLADFVTEKFMEILDLPENQDIDKTVAEEFLKTFDKVRCSDDGADTLSQVSASSQSVFMKCEGDDYLSWKGKGYKAFLEVLLKTNETNKEHGVLDGKIQLSKKVKHMQWKRGDGKILVQTENDEIILADHVIVTVSLGVLKADYETLFEPSLPTAKINAINNLGFGSVNKVFLEYEEQFWPSDWIGVSLLWRKEDVEKLKATQLDWMTDFLGFYIVAKQPRILAGWIIGPHRTEIQKLSNEEIKNASIYLLKRFAPEYNLNKPINFIRANWGIEPNFRGSYSYHSMATAASNARNCDLSEPLYGKEDITKPLVQFAGEATHNHYFSTVHGAVESGFRDAKRLKDFYNKKKLTIGTVNNLDKK